LNLIDYSKDNFPVNKFGKKIAASQSRCGLSRIKFWDCPDLSLYSALSYMAALRS